MDKKIINGIIGVFLLLFSFYYTDLSINLIRQNDPIMKEIKKSNKKFYIKSVNAKIDGNKIIPGRNGREVDLNKSFSKMKRYGSFNENLTVFKSIKPVISTDDYYDKYITSGGGDDLEIALVFTINNNIDPTNIINILNSKGIKSTFFIDGLWLENNMDKVELMKNYELELLSYDNKYSEIYFSSSLNRLSSITGRNNLYCFSDYDNKEVINLCSKYKLHTIIPTIKVGNYLYNDVVHKVRFSDIVWVPINTTSEIELGVSIDYLISKGYNFVFLRDLLSENSMK